MKLFRWPRATVVAVLIVLFLAFGLPLLKVRGLDAGVRGLLEHALSRRVEFSDGVRLRLFPWPGFGVDKVVIHEDPALGLEPVAYVSTLEASLRLRSLLRGRVELSSLRLVKPSLNLSKNSRRGWNFPSLLRHAFRSSASADSVLPRIEVRSGRLNFKFGLRKSVFYLSDADIDVEPGGKGGEAFHFRFSGEPARTDRAAQGFGRLSGNGTLVSSPTAESRIKLVIRLERSAITEVLTLVNSNIVGLNGFISSRAELRGPVSRVAVTGDLELAEVDSRFLLPRFGSDWVLHYTGRLNLKEQKLVLATSPSGAREPPVAIRYELRDYLKTPNWRLVATAKDLPLKTLPALAHEVGLDFPSKVAGRGTVDGAFHWASSEPPLGSFLLRDVVLNVPHAAPASIKRAWVKLDGNGIRLEPGTVNMPGGRQLQVAATYRATDGDLIIRSSTRGLPIRQFASAWRALTRTDVPEPLAGCETGSWRGSLKMERTGESKPSWSGRIGIRGGRFHVPGLSRPVMISSAEAELRAGGFKLTSIRGAAGRIAFRGNYGWARNRKREHRFHLEIERADATELERLFEPALRRRRHGFLARTLRIGAVSAPRWLTTRRAAGTVAVGTLEAGTIQFRSLRAKVYWDGTRVRITDLESRLGDASINGRIHITMSGTSPRYYAAAAVKELPWAGGWLSGEGRLQTAGAGPDLVRNASAEGEFSLRDFRPAPGAPLARVSGCYELTMLGGLPRLKFTSIEWDRGAEAYYGWGGVSLTGKLHLDLFNAKGTYQVNGTLVPFQLEGPVLKTSAGRKPAPARGKEPVTLK